MRGMCCGVGVVGSGRVRSGRGLGRGVNEGEVLRKESYRMGWRVVGRCEGLEARVSWQEGGNSDEA